MLILMNILILTLLIIDLVYYINKFKFDKRLCKAYEDLAMETRKARKVLEDRELKTSRSIVDMVIKSINRSIKEGACKNG